MITRGARTARGMGRAVKNVKFLALDAGALKPGADTVALVDGANAPVIALDLPGALRGHAREQVAQRVLRDQAGLAVDTVEMHPFGAQVAKGMWNRVMVADRAQVASWREAAGGTCLALLPDYLSLPAAEGVWSLRAEGGRVLARLGPDDGFSADPELAAVMLRRALDFAEMSPEAVLWDGPRLPELAALFEPRGIAMHNNADAVAAAGLPRPEVLGHGEMAFDLRKNPQATRARLRRQLAPWRWAALLALVAAVGWSAEQLRATRSMQAATQAATEESLTLTRAHFVTLGPVLDMRAQVAGTIAARRAALAETRATLSPLVLLGDAASSVAGSGARAETVIYTAAGGLSMQVVVQDFAAADQLVAALSAEGLAVTITGSRTTSDETGVRLTLGLSDAVEVQP